MFQVFINRITSFVEKRNNEQPTCGRLNDYNTNKVVGWVVVVENTNNLDHMFTCGSIICNIYTHVMMQMIMLQVTTNQEKVRH